MKTVKTFGFFKNILKPLAVLFTAGLVLSFLSSCEIGLGAAVDTQPPVVGITYPPSLSVIRDSFVLAGTWSDDQGVKTVHVDVYQSLDEGKKLIHEEEAVVSVDGKWSITLNNFDKNNAKFYNGWEYSDGDYEIQVYAEDNAKHTSGIASRTVSIDNTAPVLVITNPTTAGSDATPAAFGQIVQLKGSFYDFCGKLTSLTVTFYDESGNAICDSSFSNISDMSDANPLTVARYYSSEEDRANNKAVYNNYKALFGTDKLQEFEADNPISNSKIYFTVTANDNAKEFKTVGDEGVGNGNLTKIFYRGTASMQNLVSGDGAIESFSLVDFASYLNKTSTKHASYASTIDAIAAAAQSFSTTKAETPSIASFITNNDSTHGDPVYLTCTINPKNNPQYIIGGYELIEAGTGTENYSSAGYKTVYHGSPVPLNITVGADNKNISTHTVSFYLVDTTEYTGEINAGIFEQQHNPEYVELLYTWDEDVYNRYSAWGQDMSSRYTASSEDTNVSSIAKQFTIESLKPSHDYLFYVVGKDITGNEIIAADNRGYGFCYTVSTTAPEITITGGNKLNEVVSAKKFNGENAASLTDLLYLTGTIRTEKVLNSLSYILTVTESSDSVNPPTLQKTYTVPLEELDAAPGYTYSSPNFCYTTNAAVSPVTYTWRIATAQVSSDFASIIASPGSYDVTLVIKANNDAESSTQRTFTLDTKAPEAEATEISNSVEKQGGGYWINPAKAYKIKGLVTDNLSTPNACKTWIVLKAIDENEEELSANYSTESNKVTGVKTWEFTVPANAIASSNYGANLYIYSQDVAGNIGVTSQPVTLYFDTVAPRGVHKIDYKNKDIVFRVSDFDSSAADVAATDGTVTYSDALDKDVGGKYLKGSYSNTSTLKIRGYFEEHGSGVDMIYYRVFNTAPSASDITNFKNNYANSESTYKATGYFKPLDTPEIKQVMFQPNNDDWYAAKVKSSFKETISGLDHPNNYLVLLAVDKVGNYDVDTLTGEWITHDNNDEVVIWKETTGGDVETTNSISAWNNSLKAFSLNVDSESPILNCTSHSGQQYTNGVSQITVSGTFTDNPSGTCAGVSSISINVNGVDSYATLTPVAADDYSSGSWTATILSSTLSALEQGKTYNANGTIKDRAGNTSSATMFTLSFDKQGPSVKVETPAKNTLVNGTISMTGSVEYEGSAPVKLELYAQKTAPSGAPSGTPVETITDPSKIYSWSITNINTYTITNVAASPTTANLYIIPVVTDGAGNTNIYDLSTSSYKYTLDTNYFKYTVDMDSDRPTVKVTNLTNTGTAQAPVYILKYGENAKIEGSVSDDDSTSEKVVKTFIATTSQLTLTTGVTTTSAGGIITSKVKVGNDYDITTLNPVTGEWTFTPANTGDGQKTVYFYVVDNADAIFYTGKSEAYLNPYFQFKTSDAVDNTSAISYKSDATSPVIQYTQIQNGSNWDDVTATTKVGGTVRPNAVFKIEASDANGIAEIRLTLEYNLKTDANNAAKRQLKYTSIDTHDGFTKNGTVDTTNNYIWTTTAINVSTWRTDSVSGTVETYDTSGLLATASPIFFVDNDGPSINITSPSSVEELTGTQKFIGFSTDGGGGAGLDKTYWLIPTAAQRAMGDEALATETWNDELNGTSSYTAWEFEVSGEILGNNVSNATASNEGVYTLPFYVMATDALGNCTIDRSKTIKYNPEGDRPKTKITYPNDTDYKEGENYLTLGGAIRITGTSEIPSGTTTVKAAYLQVINGTGNSTDLSTYTNNSTYVSGLTYNGNHCYTVHNASQAATDLGFTNLQFATGVNSSNWWGIKVNNAASWNFTINNNGEMNPQTEGTVNYVAIRACAVNEEGKVGTWTDWYYLNIDNTAPTQSAYIYQFNSAPTQNCTASTVLANSNIKASNSYANGMYLKGNWYLTVKLDDESRIDSFEVKKGVDSLTAGTGYFASKLEGTGNNPKTQYLFIPVDTTNPAVAYTVTVQDTEHSISKTYSLNIDNDAPVIESVYKGETYNAENALTAGENKITDSNYIYTLGSKVDETASGFERFVFYYVRAGNSYSSQVLLDPLITTGAGDSKVALNDLTARTFTQGNVSYTLYSKSVAGTLGADGYTFTPTTAGNITGNAHIRKGGLIEANGMLRKIEAINETTGAVTFDTSSGVTASTSATVYFPYAQVVDNTGNESTTDNTGSTFTFKNNSDDGDGMPESVEGSKTTGYTLTSTIHSKNMPDGPCALVVLAFDKAGNVSGQTYQVKIENSAPRLAKVWLGTDLNSNGSWQANEFVGYDLYNANVSAGITKTEVKAKQTISTASYGGAFKIKDKLAVVTEIVGGNGSISMIYGKDAANDNPVKEADGAKATAVTNNTITGVIAAGDKIGTVIYNNADTSTTLKSFTLTNEQLVGTVSEANDGTGKSASFTFWDETEELTQGTNSQNCVFRVTDFTIDLVDGVKPNVVVAPFFWNGKTNNSLYQNSLENGHIELESDWTALADDGTTKLTGWDGKAKNQGTYLDSDPKVSGKIVVRGTAYDDKLLKTLQFSMTNFDSGTAKTFATYNKTSGNWEISQVNSANPVMATNYYEVTVTPDYLDQAGHKVNWEIAIDTSHLSDVAHVDAAFTVIAVDNADGSSTARAASETAGDATLHRPTYYMDVVPYITDISTGDMDTGTKRYLRRSASGAFVANIDDTTNKNVTIIGYNLKGGSVSLGTTAKNTAASGNNLTVTKASLSTSGNIKVTNNSMDSLNNINNDAAEYNKEASQFAPNHTDGRYIYMWDTTTTAYSGTEAVMKPVINAQGNKTGNMMWLYASNNQYLFANDQQLTTSWAGAIYGGNFAYNTSGSPSWTFLHNMNWSGNETSYPAFGSVQWAKTFNNIGAAYSWNRPRDNLNYARLGLGNLSFGGNTQSYAYNKAVMKRYENIKMLIKGDNTDSLNMVAYFDKADESRSIVFWRFHEGTGIDQKLFQQTNNTNTGWNATSNATYTDMSRITQKTYAYNAQQSQTAVGLDTPAGREEITTAKSGADSNYFDMAYDSVKNVVYIAYYDEVAGGLKIRYLNDPAAGYYGNWTNSWATAVEIDPDAAGQYVSMKTDGSGNIHLAYYDSTGSYLKYAMLTPVGNSGAITDLTVSKKVLVDTLFTNGMYNSITLRQFGTNDVRPVITSYSISYGGTKYSLRTSWPLTSVADIEAGATGEDGYTGKWETVVVVSANAPKQDNTYTETKGTGYTGNIIVGYTASKLEQAELLF
ncbi:MAG: hypothetical protein J5726_00675 [Treponema sp.]|nr:hypothetical protein [Treponema sp.]